MYLVAKVSSDPSICKSIGRFANMLMRTADQTLSLTCNCFLLEPALSVQNRFQECCRQILCGVTRFLETEVLHARQSHSFNMRTSQCSMLLQIIPMPFMLVPQLRNFRYMQATLSPTTWAHHVL